MIYEHNPVNLSTETTVRHPEPAFKEHEIVHIAELIGEIRLEYSGRHKGTDPENACKIVFL